MPMKKKKKSKKSVPVRTTAEELNRFYDQIFDKVFQTGQMIWWMTLYVSEEKTVLDEDGNENVVKMGMGWEEESCRCFTHHFVENVRDQAKNMADDEIFRKMALEQIAETGINVFDWADMIGTTARFAMCKKFIARTPREMAVKVAASYHAIVEAMFLGLYTFKKDFNSANWYIENCIEHYADWCCAYGNGWTDEKTLQYMEANGVEVDKNPPEINVERLASDF